MSQELVTATVVATANAVSANQLRAAQFIGERLNEALLAEGYERANFSTEVQSLLQQAWAVASHKCNTQVSIYHIAYALVFDRQICGYSLAEYLDTDVDAFEGGCILCILSLGVDGSVRDREPSVGTTRWVGQAAELARLRGQGSELQSGDLVQVVLNQTLPSRERGMFRKAARVGEARYGTVIRTTPVKPIAEAQSRDIIEHLQNIEDGTDNALLVSFNKFEERYSNDIEAQKHAFASVNERLSSIEERISPLNEVRRGLNAVDIAASATDTRLAAIEQHVRPIDDVATKLGVIDDHVLALGKSLPRPPSGHRLFVAIVAVLAFGMLTGLGLTKLQNNAQDLSNVAAVGE